MTNIPLSNEETGFQPCLFSLEKASSPPNRPLLFVGTGNSPNEKMRRCSPSVLSGDGYISLDFIRSLSKLPFVREVQEGSERKTGVNTGVNEDFSTELTEKFSTQVECRKRSIHKVKKN